MIALAILFGLLSMIGYALVNVYSQPLAQKYGSANLLFQRGLTIIVVLGLASIPSYARINHHVGSALEIFLLGVIGYIPALAFTHSVKVSRISVMTPIAGTSTLLSVLLAFWLLHAPISNLQWVAVVLVIVANIAVSVNLRDLRNSDALNLSSGVPFALIAAIGWGVFFFVIIYPTRVLGPWVSALLVEAGVTVAAGLHVYQEQRRLSVKNALTPGIMWNGLMIVLGTAGYTIGISRYNLAIVITLANSPAVISSYMAIKLFKEKLRPLEIWATAAMIIGVIIISFGS